MLWSYGEDFVDFVEVTEEVNKEILIENLLEIHS